MAAVPIGLSFGDVVAAIKLCRNISRALSDHHGAPHAYQSIAADINSLVWALEEVRKLQLRPEHHQYVDALRDRTERIHQVLARINKNLEKHEGDIGGAHAESGWRQHPLAKARWALKSQPSIEQYRKDLEYESLGLKLVIHGLNLRISMEAERTGNQVLSLLERYQQDFADIKNSLHNLRPNEGVSSRSAWRQAQTPAKSMPVTFGARINTTSAEILNDNDDDDMLPVDWYMATSNDDNDERQRILLVLALFTVFYDSINAIFLLALVAFPMLRLVPRSVTLLLPDNVCITDPLGRPFSRPIDFFRTWDYVELFLKHAFASGVPGAAKVEKGQFRIFDIRDPDQNTTKMSEVQVSTVSTRTNSQHMQTMWTLVPLIRQPLL
ncbi:hypothetical protein B0T14DRAFT_601161 [Immersiella caudata]|uniref:Ubiquitin-like domain-containing protein n=1 Tax=Immersiella caudata TaxID=314043 RepID=A0AA40C2B2_9PEZI|nr:hypothetical protein B0T14DRAFT_601161 [Immersiella caudata]